jgi:glycosyltransferase involved in cell wall biosynthesis
MGMCTQDKVADILSASACGVVPYRESLQVAYSNSCKLVEYMACGLPIVATRSGDNTRVLGEAGGQLVETSDPVQLGDSIIKQLDRPIEPPFPEKWQWSKLGSRLDQFLGELCGNQ